MKTILLEFCFVLAFSGMAFGQVLTLNSPETLAVPIATKIDLKNINIDITQKTVTVTYRFLTEDNAPIPIIGGGESDRVWKCSDNGDTCFTDTFSFVIRSQDVGTMIGKGLRALIWSKMRPDVLTGSNNATLP